MHHLRWLLQPLTGFIAAFLLLLNLMLWFLWYLPAQAELDQAGQRLGEALARTLAFDIAAPLQRGDRLAISLLLNRTAEEPLVVNTALHSDSADRNLTLESRPSNVDPIEPVLFRHPVHFESEMLGHAEVLLDARPRIDWQTRTLSSWFLFNALAFAAGFGLLYWRSHLQHRTLARLTNQLGEHIPEWKSGFDGPPEQQIDTLVNRLTNALDRNGQLLRTLAASPGGGEAERLLEQVHLAGEKGAYCDVALLNVQCHNWDELTRHYDAHQLQTLWARYEHLITQVGELYGGVLLPEGFTLVFGLGDDEQYALHAVCAARVLQIAAGLMAGHSQRRQPRFGYGLSAGPAFVSRTTKHGLPLPLVTGDAVQWLQQVSALQPRDAIYLAEPILQYRDVNQNIEVTLMRDVTLSDGGRLEVWELDGIRGNQDRLLESQARTLLDAV